MRCRLLLVSGSLRAASTNTAALRTAREVAGPEVEIVLYERVGHLPPFNPDDDTGTLHPEVAGLRAAIHAADAIADGATRAHIASVLDAIVEALPCAASPTD